jgi:hypothetical protein
MNENAGTGVRCRTVKRRYICRNNAVPDFGRAVTGAEQRKKRIRRKTGAEHMPHAVYSPVCTYCPEKTPGGQNAERTAASAAMMHG